MAIYSFSGDVFTRSRGHRATAAAAYRAGVELYDETLGERFDYHRKRGILHSEIITPEGAPEWMHNREALWNAVEKQENRSNSQLARDIMVALPHELDEAQRLELLRGFVREQFVDAGMVADFSVHAPAGQGDQRNHHAHIMLTMRRVDGDGFSTKKAREWNSPELMEQWREAWADHCNDAFERAGLEGVSVSHLSLEAQGIDREAGIHRGKDATNAERKGKQSERAERAREIEERNRKYDAIAAELAEVEAAIIAQQERELDERYRSFEPEALNDRADDPEWETAGDARDATYADDLDAYVNAVADGLREEQAAEPWTAAEIEAPAEARGEEGGPGWWQRIEDYLAGHARQIRDTGEIGWRDGLTWFERATQVLDETRHHFVDWASDRVKTFVDFIRDDRDNSNDPPDLER